MGAIQVKKENGNRPAAAIPTVEWEPARLMRSLLQWDPFREMIPFVPEERGGFVPAFDIKETKEGYVFKADIPGVKESDLEVTLTGNRLTISGKREAEKEEKTETLYTYERSYGSFTRSFTLPEGIENEKVNAEMKDGVLSIFVAKKPELQPKKIDVQAR
jgi:HSP20 family protein